MTCPSELRIPVGYPDADTSNGAGMGQADFTGKSLITIAALRQRDTFRLLEPEFQRRYLAMAAAAWVEAGLLLGVGTGWRSEKEQAANHLKWPNQFAPVSASNHMRKPPNDVAYAIDSVPYDALGWAHANCARFGINYLDHIPNERHHCQPIELPNSGSAYWVNPVGYATACAVVLDVPYVGLQLLDEWLAADLPLTLVPPTPEPEPEPEPTPEPEPEPEPTPDPLPVEEDDMQFIAKSKTTGKVYSGNGTTCFELATEAQRSRVKTEMDAGLSRWHHPSEPGWPLVTTFDAVPVVAANDLPLFALIGVPR